MSMFCRVARRRFSATSSSAYKVAVLGANGGIGQPLSLLLKLNDRVTDLRLYDLKGAKGVATDLSHIPTNSVVRGFTAESGDAMRETLSGADVVLVPAGVPRKPGMTRDDLFVINAGVVQQLAQSIAQHAPKAAVLVISNPVNSTVPIVAEVFKGMGTYDPRKLFGVTTLDSIRASRFISEVQGTNPTEEHVPIVGGHSGITIIPLLSQSKHPSLSKETRDALVHRIQFGGDEVVQVKSGAGSATLSMARAGAKFADAVLAGLAGEKNVVEPAFVDSPLYKDEGIEFFASSVTLGPRGVEKVHPVGEVSAEEEELLAKCKETLKQNIAKGIAFVK